MVRYPACAATWAMPCPMVPAPITPTVVRSLIGRRSLCESSGAGRALHAVAMERLVVVDLQPVHGDERLVDVEGVARPVGRADHPRQGEVPGGGGDEGVGGEN